MHSHWVVRLVVAVAAVAVVLFGVLASSAAVPTARAGAVSAPGPEAAGPGPAGAAGHGTDGRGVGVVTNRQIFRLPESPGAPVTPNARNIALRSAAGGPLLLFLPATGQTPIDYQQLLQTASSLGYHVLALDYWNLGHSVAQTCSTDAGCYGDVQANRFDGSHPTRYSAIAPSDSILSRLTRVLSLLQQRDPTGGWGRYVGADGIQWDRIVVAGHSQGGGESAFIAHEHEVQGVLLFGSPIVSDGTTIASWLEKPGRTPIARYYGFDSRDDEFAARIIRSWSVLGIGGTEPVARISTTVPVGGSHRIVTDYPLGDPVASHLRIAIDSGPRTAAGVPVFRPVWLWMLQAVRT